MTREEAIKDIEENILPIVGGKSLRMAIDALRQPERKKGKWIKISPANIYECSECGKNVMTDDISAYDFCHGCGADMRTEGNDDN